MEEEGRIKKNKGPVFSGFSAGVVAFSAFPQFVLCLTHSQKVCHDKHNSLSPQAGTTAAHTDSAQRDTAMALFPAMVPTGRAGAGSASRCAALQEGNKREGGLS